MLYKAENQFSFTRVAPSTCGAKKQFPISYTRVCYGEGKMLSFILGFEARLLPMPLNARSAIVCKQSVEETLRELLKTP